MKHLKHLVLVSLISTCQLLGDEIVPQEDSLADIVTRTNLSFTMDDNGNLNPSLFVPVYYGDEKQFFSGVGYASENTNEVGAIDNFNLKRV